SGKNLSLGYALGATTLDTVIVTGTSLAAVDTTSATVGTTLNLDIVEALPTERSYQSYLQLVPGVKPSQGGNPSSKSGVNYSDVGGAIGSSTDNVYYLDGVNVTDPLTGTFGANFNSEIIQEQQVLTGGIPAEYAGGAGLVSKVITKSGGDEFHGSVNYYLQNDSLVSDDKHGRSAGFSTFDTAITLGGPIIKEKLWFFGSYQIKNREDEVLNDGEYMRTVNTDQEYGFFKATWQISDNDRLTATFFNDPYERDSSTASTTLNNRAVARNQGGDNYKVEYTHDWDNLRLNLYGFTHESEVSNIPADTSTRNNVAFRRAATLEEQQLGGSGTTLETWRNRDEFGLSAEYWLDTAFGSHTFKAGFTTSDNEYQEDNRYTGTDGALYTSIGTEFAGSTFDEVVGGGWSASRGITSGDGQIILDALDRMTGGDKAYFMGVLDANSDGTVTLDELGDLEFNSTAGNPGGQVNTYRIVQATAAPYSVKSKGKAIYLQDTWTLNQWTVNAGIRAEDWTHYDSSGNELINFDWKLAPRLSVVYDLNG